jgi:hypothetical protein
MGRPALQDYKKLYKEHLKGMTILELSKKYKCSVMNIYSYFYKYGMKLNKDIPRFRKTIVNHNYLDEIDTEDKAYFLGMMLADGYMNKENRFAIGLKISDKYLVEKMFAYFCSGYKGSFGKINNEVNNFVMGCTSERIFEKLCENGCIRNKTIKKFKVPDINKDYFRHFIRGYFDGDGSISNRKNRSLQKQIYICSIDENFLLELQEKLKLFSIETRIFKEVREGKPLKTPNGKTLTNCKNMYKLQINDHINRLKFFEFLYKDCTIKLERKYNLYNEYYTNTVLNLENKGSKSVQRIGNETIIDFEKIKSFNFRNWMEQKPDKIYKQNEKYKV